MSRRSHSDFVIPLLRSLRGDILTHYGQTDHGLKENRTVVTEVDRYVEQKLSEALLAEYPDIGVLGEEFGVKGNENTYWLVDPIDGTESYVRGLPGVTSMIGLVDDDMVVESFVYDPVHDTMYSALRGSGAYKDDEKIQVSSREVSRSIIAIGSHVLERKPAALLALKEAGVFYMSQYFGAGIKAIYMASGKIDGIIIDRPQSHGGVWDYGPTMLLVQEAGGVITQFDDNGINAQSYVIFTPTNNQELISAIDEVMHA